MSDIDEAVYERIIRESKKNTFAQNDFGMFYIKTPIERVQEFCQERVKRGI